jgi:hypothetical protein
MITCHHSSQKHTVLEGKWCQALRKQTRGSIQESNKWVLRTSTSIEWTPNMRPLIKRSLYWNLLIQSPLVTRVEQEESQSSNKCKCSHKWTRTKILNQRVAWGKLVPQTQYQTTVMPNHKELTAPNIQQVFYKISGSHPSLLAHQKQAIIKPQQRLINQQLSQQARRLH